MKIRKPFASLMIDIVFASVASLLVGCGNNGSHPHPLTALTVSTTAAPASGVVTSDVVRITSINGTATPLHANDIYIHPGDVVTLSADSFLAAQNFAPAGLPVESFQWNSSINPQDICNAGQNINCLTSSSFQVNDFGVAFYSPYAMPESIQISVRNALRNDLNQSGTPVIDQIRIHNMDFVAGLDAVTPQMVVNPARYSLPTLNENAALIGMGRWVTLGSVRYFSPYTYITPGETEWAPYRHGYWAWEANGGWTWISYDPWGWMTDHYGIWRHHATYGWIWLPFEDRHYEPHNVTWIDQGSYIGWFPYRANFHQAYTPGFAEGFDDGYWAGAREIALNYGQPIYRFHPGFAIANRRDITNSNLITVLINKTLVVDNISLGVISGAYEQKRFFAVPGGEKSGSRAFLEQFAARPAAITTAAYIQSKGGAKFIVPHAVNPVPQESLAFLNSLSLQSRPMPIGSVARAHLGDIHFIEPALNGRGVAVPPVLRNEAGEPVGRLQVAITHPTQFEAKNPIGQGRNGSGVNTLSFQTLPTFDPRAAGAHNAAPMIPLSMPRAVQPHGGAGVPIAEPEHRTAPSPATSHHNAIPETQPEARQALPPEAPRAQQVTRPRAPREAQEPQTAEPIPKKTRPHDDVPAAPVPRRDGHEPTESTQGTQHNNSDDAKPVHEPQPSEHGADPATPCTGSGEAQCRRGTGR